MEPHKGIETLKVVASKQIVSNDDEEPAFSASLRRFSTAGMI